MQGVAFTPEETERFKKEIIEFLGESIHGTFSAACHKLGVSKTVGYEWRQADSKFDKAISQARSSARESGLDLAEGKLLSAINNGELTAILFYLKTQGKHRGFVERSEQEVSGRDGGPVTYKSMGADDTELNARILELAAKARPGGATGAAGGKKQTPKKG